MAALTSIAASVAAFAYGCGNGSDRYPPPPLGGTGTKPGTSSGAGGSTSAPFDCSCVTGMGDPDAGSPCATCFDDAGASGEPCSKQNEGCNKDSDCLALFECVVKCKYTVACIDGCAASLNHGKAVSLYKQLFACTCVACPQQCPAAKPVECSLTPYPDSGSPDSAPDGSGSDAGADADTDADAGP